MKRRLFNLAAAVSLLVCAATLLLWARSYRMGDQVFVLNLPLGKDVNFISRGGVVGIGVYSAPPRPGGVSVGRISDPQMGVPMIYKPRWSFPERLGFQVTPSSRFGFLALALPHWFLAASAAVLPFLWAVSRWRHPAAARRQREGLCPSCGYDLRGSPGPTCPECGAERASNNAG